MDNQLEEELKSLKRRMDSIQKTLDLLYNDRNILEDIIARIVQLENALHLNKEHQTEVQKNINANIQEAQTATEHKVDEMKQVIDKQTVVIKSSNGNIFKAIYDRLKGVR